LVKDPQADKTPNLASIAAATGVSVATVSYALSGSGRVAPQTRERIRKVAEEWAYQQPRRRKTRSGIDTRAIVVVLSANDYEDRTPNYYVGDLLAGVESAASPLGAEIMIGFWHEQRPRVLSSKDAAGVLYLGADFDMAELRSVPLPGVLVGSYLPGCPLPSVLADNRQGVYLSTKALIDSGCRRIALASGLMSAPTSGDKYLGFLDALREAGLAPDPDHIVDVEFSVAGGIEAGERLFSSTAAIDGIVAGDDPIALGLLQVARKRGIDIPSDISVIGYGDSPMAESSDPPLSTVQVDRRAMAALAVEMLTDIGEPSYGSTPRTLLPPSVVFRGTTHPL